MMEWTLPCLLWIALASSSAQDYQGIFFNYPQEARSIQTRKIDYSEDSRAQKLQDNKKERILTRVDDKVLRTENSVFPTISSRQGEIQDRSGDAVVFPGPTLRSSSVVPDVPDECKSLGICENIPNYPHEIVNNILSKLGHSKNLLVHFDQLDEPQITQRFGPGDSQSIDLELCNSREHIIKPKAAKDVKGDWHFILNTQEQSFQGYRIEICKNEGRSCANNFASIRTGYTAYCKQKYVHRTMTAINIDKQELVSDVSFRVPSCCSCVVRQVDRG